MLCYGKVEHLNFTGTPLVLCIVAASLRAVSKKGEAQNWKKIKIKSIQKE